MHELSNIFTAYPKSTFDLLSAPGLGYYIPPYQRPYSWGKDHTLQLLGDVVHGIEMLHDREGDSITFLGTLILIHDVKFTTVEPQVKGELPSKVMLIIDGQQRITTLLLLNAVLLGELSARIAQISKKGNEAADFGLEWIRQRAIQTRANLAMTLYQDMNVGEADFRFYPRVIRAFSDSWSRKPEQAKYASPIAEFLHMFGAFARLPESRKQFQLDIADHSGSHKALTENWKIIRSFLRTLAGADQSTDQSVDERMPDPTDIGQSAQEAIFQQPLPEEVAQIAVATDGASREQIAGREMLRLLLFARYLLDRVAVTEVVAKDDEYAFDIFEALNTTGDPLTAFDTFKPKVIKAESEGKYEKSPSYSMMKGVEEYLDGFKRADEKHEATSRLLIPFALAETGRKLSKRLGDQRKYLKDEYEAQAPVEDKRQFVQHLSEASEFLRRVWPDDSSKPPDVPEFGKLGAEEQQRAGFCLEVLRSAKHSVTIAPLIRFFSRLQRETSESAKQAASAELVGALFAVTAFFGLWRGSRASTGNIDQQYRTLMSRGFAPIGPFARRPETPPAEQPSLSKLRAALRLALRNPELGKIPTKADWVKLASEQPVYDAVVVARLLLFAATHNSFADPSSKEGLIAHAKDGTLDLLTPQHWRTMTVEHIAPQKKGGWDPNLYDEPDFVHRLGNLTLLPTAENSSVSNRPWEAKRMLYAVLSNPDPNSLNEMITRAADQGIQLATSTEAILAEAKLHAQLGALARVESTWTKALVQVRSSRLAELAWDQLASWLGIGPGEAV